MPVFTRPTGLESFILHATGPVLVTAALVLSQGGCDAGKSDGGDGKTAAAKPGKAGGISADTPTTPTEPTEPADDGCCRYCFVGTPCGDGCIDEGKTCDKPEGQGCACTKDKREAKKFPKNYRVRPNTGLVGPDVFNYNKAQGDPLEGPFTLEMAFEGAPELADASTGTLKVVFHTSMGKFECELYEKQAPLTVANFVGLARGVRPFLDPKDRKATEWIKRPYYDGTVFHRVIQNFMIQGGDPTAMGVGTPGYFIPDEFDPSLRHDGPGYLSMANRNPFERATNKPIYDEETGLTVGNTGSAQFFVTVNATEALNDRHTIFGKCDTEVPMAISKVRTQSQPIKDKPFEDVVIEKLEFVRKL